MTYKYIMNDAPTTTKENTMIEVSQRGENTIVWIPGRDSQVIKGSLNDHDVINAVATTVDAYYGHRGAVKFLRAKICDGPEEQAKFFQRVLKTVLFGDQSDWSL